MTSTASSPVGRSELEDVLDTEGRVLDQYTLRKNAFYRGLAVHDRPFLWKFFLEFYPYNSTTEERRHIDKEKQKQYENLKSTWTAKLPESVFLQDYKRLILKDVARTEKYHSYFKCEQTDRMLFSILMSVVEYNSDLGYIQGMNDLLAPLLLTLQVEYEAFWCLVALINRGKRNFEDLSLSGPLNLLSRLCEYMDPPLYAHLEMLSQNSDWLFCYRWMLLDFKREFSIEDICCLWECMWTCPLTREFGMFIGAAILSHLRNTLTTLQSFEQVMEFTSAMVQNVPLKSTLTTARGLLNQIRSDDACPHHLKVLVDNSFVSPPPLVGFVRMRQSLSTRKQMITHVNVWNSIFGDEPVRPIVEPLPSLPLVTPPTSGFVPRTTCNNIQASDSSSHQHPHASHQHPHPSHQHPSHEQCSHNHSQPSHQHPSHEQCSHNHSQPSHITHFDELRSEANLDLL